GGGSERNYFNHSAPRRHGGERNSGGTSSRHSGRSSLQSGDGISGSDFLYCGRSTGLTSTGVSDSGYKWGASGVNDHANSRKKEFRCANRRVTACNREVIAITFPVGGRRRPNIWDTTARVPPLT